MGETTKSLEQPTRMRWNDIRVVGPVLVVALLMAALVSPQFATAEQSVGFSGPTDPPSIDLCAPPALIETFAFVSEEVNSAAAHTSSEDCCIDPDLLLAVGAILLPECEEPEPAVSTPARQFVAPPPPIEGPIWLGATQSAMVNGSLQFHPPLLLAMMIDNNIVSIADDDGDVVYLGKLAGDIAPTLVSSIGADGYYTMKTLLSTGALYTEVILVGDPEATQ